MGNRRTREKKSRRKDIPLENVQDLRETARLGMEKHRHPPVIGSDPSKIVWLFLSSYISQI